MKQITIKVKGMVCGGCENRIQNSLKEIKGIQTVEADHNKETVFIQMDEKVKQDILFEKIEDLGFEVVKDH